MELRHSRLTVRLRVLFLRFTVFPAERKKVGAGEGRAAGQQEQGKPPEKKRSPSRKFERTVSRMLTLVRGRGGDPADGAGARCGCARSGWFSRCRGTDAADTALFYGRFCGWFYGAIATAQNFLDLEFDQIELIPDFAGENKYRRSFYCKIGATPFIMLVVSYQGVADCCRRTGCCPRRRRTQPGKNEKKRPQGSPRAEEDRGEKA